jgi:hypothetical protein
VIVCQSAIKRMLRNMSLLNVRLPGLLPRVEYIAALVACIAMDKALSMYSVALAISLSRGSSTRVPAIFFPGGALTKERSKD